MACQVKSCRHLKVGSLLQSSDYKKIYSVIIDSYHTTKVLKPVAEDAFMLQVRTR